MRKQHIAAIGDPTSKVGDVAVVGSWQSSPQTDKPWHIRAASFTDKTERFIDVRLSGDEAQKLVQDWVAMGLFGRHGRIEGSVRKVA
jgi:hypothetical protein